MEKVANEQVSYQSSGMCSMGLRACNILGCASTWACRLAASIVLVLVHHGLPNITLPNNISRGPLFLNHYRMICLEFPTSV